MGTLGAPRFEGNGDDRLPELEALRVASRKKLRQGVDSRQASVARCDAVAAVSLEVLEKALNPLDTQIGEFERLDPSRSILGGEPKQEHDRIAIAANSVLTHAPLGRQMVLEEPRDGSPEIAADTPAHG